MGIAFFPPLAWARGAGGSGTTRRGPAFYGLRLLGDLPIADWARANVTEETKL
jgi:hypothetical protein